MPDAFIGVDLIVGARGETDEEFEVSRRFIESLDISRLHVFPYSERPGTRALQLGGCQSGRQAAQSGCDAAHEREQAPRICFAVHRLDPSCACGARPL